MSENPRTTDTQTRPDTELATYLDTLLAEIDAAAESKPQQKVKERVAQADTLQQEVTPVVAVGVERDSDETESNVPHWAEIPFQVLRFEVDGVNLVVPLASLTGIITLDGPVNRLPGQPAWSLGVVMNRDAKVVVVDTRRVLMPDRDFTEPAYTHLLLFGDGDRGLAVDVLGDTVTLDKEAVRWRGKTVVKQPWYGGILVDELSVLLDVEGVLQMLAA